MALRRHAVAVLLQSALLFAHLVLIGIPVRFGFIFGVGSCGSGDDDNDNDWWWQNPTSWWSTSNADEESSQPRCCRELFTDGTTSCTVAELIGIRDYGYRFGLHYQLCWIVWLVVTFVMPNKHRGRPYSTTASASIVYFHKVLIVCSSGTMVLLAWLQNYFVAVDDDGETSSPSSARRTATTGANDDVLSEEFVSSMYFYHLLAISVSIGAILFNDQQQQQQQQQQHHQADERERQNHVDRRNGTGGHAVAGVAETAAGRGVQPDPLATRRPPSQVKWSIPANSIWFGAIINTLIAVASLQLLLDRGQYYYGVGGLERYYRNNNANDNNNVVTPAVRYGFAFATFCTALHATILFQIRNVLCTTKQLRTICLYKFVSSALLQQPWLPPSRVINADTRWILAIRVALTVSYLNGFLWAGKAEGIGRILNSEKED